MTLATELSRVLDTSALTQIRDWAVQATSSLGGADGTYEFAQLHRSIEAVLAIQSGVIPLRGAQALAVWEHGNEFRKAQVISARDLSAEEIADQYCSLMTLDEMKAEYAEMMGDRE